MHQWLVGLTLFTVLAACGEGGLPSGDAPGQPGIPMPFPITEEWLALKDEWLEDCKELGLVNLDDCPEPPDPASWPPGGPLPEFPWSQVLEGEFGPLEPEGGGGGEVGEAEPQGPSNAINPPGIDYDGDYCADYPNAVTC